MHIKHMHEMIEKLVDCTKQAIENDETCVGQYPIGDVVDMIKDLNEAEYYAHISKAMDEAKEEEEEEEKYMLRKFKEEANGDEEQGRRFYDDWRYMRSGRFAPHGKGSYDPRGGRSRRGYTEMMPMYDIIPEIYRDDYEWNRDMDRPMGRMYYSGDNSSNGNMGNMSGNRSGGSDNYSGSDGRRNYDGEGRSDGRRNNENRQESRYDKARRGFEEVKMAHNGNTPEDKQMTMREAEKFVGIFLDGIEDALEDASPEVKALVKSKTTGRVQKW